VESVVAYLVTNGGVDPARLVAVGGGERKSPSSRPHPSRRQRP